jgi:hypothetical protein
MSFIPPVLGDLALLAMVLCAALGTTLALVLLLTRRARVALVVAGVTVALGVLYGVALVGVALASRERVLAPGEEKSCSGFDAHLHYRVVAAHRDSGGVIVTVHVRSDALVAVQDPSFLRVALFDSRGRRYVPVHSSAGRPGAEDRFPPLARRLTPGTSYDAVLRFEPDADAIGLRLLIDEFEWPVLVTIGSEGNPLSKKVWFALPGI